MKTSKIRNSYSNCKNDFAKEHNENEASPNSYSNSDSSVKSSPEK